MPRRSNRVPGSSALERTSVVRLLDQIRADYPRVEILKLHDYLPADVSTPIINAVLKALMRNSNCQALYIQNVSIGFRDEQLRMLAKVLRRGNIWCLNAGENSGITPSAWWWFVEEIKTTSVTVSAKQYVRYRPCCCAWMRLQLLERIDHSCLFALPALIVRSYSTLISARNASLAVSPRPCRRPSVPTESSTPATSRLQMSH